MFYQKAHNYFPFKPFSIIIWQLGLEISMTRACFPFRQILVRSRRWNEITGKGDDGRTLTNEVVEVKMAALVGRVSKEALLKASHTVTSNNVSWTGLLDTFCQIACSMTEEIWLKMSLHAHFDKGRYESLKADNGFVTIVMHIPIFKLSVYRFLDCNSCL